MSKANEIELTMEHYAPHTDAYAYVRAVVVLLWSLLLN